MGLTCHFISSEKRIETRLLDCSRFSEQHTADNICKEISEIMAYYEITSKVITITADHAANVKKAIRLLKIYYVGCFGHDLNLIAQDLLKNVPKLSALRDKVSAIVTYTRQSSRAKEKFDMYQRQLNATHLKLHQAVPHRWNSMYFMFQRFLELKQAVILFLSEEDEFDTLSAEEWDDISIVIKLLKPLYDVTLELCSEKHTSSSKVIPLINILKKSYSQIDAERGLAKDLCAAILNEFKNRFKDVEQAHYLALATLLDPRFKNKLFENPTNIARTLRYLKDEACQAWVINNLETRENEPPNKKPCQVSTNHN